MDGPGGEAAGLKRRQQGNQCDEEAARAGGAGRRDLTCEG